VPEEDIEVPHEEFSVRVTKMDAMQRVFIELSHALRDNVALSELNSAFEDVSIEWAEEEDEDGDLFQRAP
jgi:superfamily II helicase